MIEFICGSVCAAVLFATAKICHGMNTYCDELETKIQLIEASEESKELEYQLGLDQLQQKFEQLNR